jgi:HSP20 family molecular chaperone IbpA
MANLDTTNRKLSRSLSETEQREPRQQVPAADIFENENEYLVVADMPGVTPSDVAIQLNAEELSIQGQRQAFDGASEVYRRVFRIGPDVDPNGVAAELKNGVLHLTAKKSEARRPRQISVRAG